MAVEEAGVAADEGKLRFLVVEVVAEHLNLEEVVTSATEVVHLHLIQILQIQLKDNSFMTNV